MVLSIFKINTDSDNYRLDIYRLGYYDGDGARLVGSIQHNGAVTQPSPIVDLSTATVDAGNWSVTDSWQIPSDAVSGVYIAKLVREDGTQGENQIPFIVRDDASHSDIVFQTSDTTWQAYNTWGGSSLYQNSLDTNPNPPDAGPNRAFAVSYNRPVATQGVDQLFGSEYAAISWLEKNGYDVSYISGVDTARSGSELLNHQVFLSVGHDEYWSAQQRANVEAARDAGVNLAFWSGNTSYWEARWAPSLDSTHSDYRTLVTYKELFSQADIDPSSQWTGTWRDPRNTAGSDPENSLTGTAWMVDASRSDTISVSSDYSRLRFWANTDIAQLQSGQSIQLAPGSLGFEWDIDWDNGFRPAGLIDLSSTSVFVNTLVKNPWMGDAGGLTSGNATHSLTLYRAASGALVFSAGDIDWAWNLDSHNAGGVAPDQNVQQAMVNLFAEMGVQPQTVQSGLVLGSQSTDHIAPQATIVSVSNGAKVGGSVAVVGTAADSGGGVVAGVEFSGDGGLTWHHATGWENWTYKWTPDRIGLQTIEARAVDDSLNLGTSSGSATTTVFVNFGVAGFDPGYYLDTNPDVKASGIDPYTHYSKYGWKEGRNPDVIFSVKDYLNANPDVAHQERTRSRISKALDGKMGRDPSPRFDMELYLAHNPDVKASGMNPLNHYLLYGKAEGRAIYDAIGKVNSIGFDAEYYLFHNPDVAAAHIDPYQHYLKYGWKEGRDPSAYFDTSAYLAANPDVAASGMNPLLHYDKYGWKEGRDPSANFDTSAYLAANPDVAAAHIDPLVHFLKYGIFELRDPHGGSVLSV